MPKKTDKSTPKPEDVDEATNNDQPDSSEYHLVLKKKRVPKAKWYVVHTYSGHEQKVAKQLAVRVEALKLVGQIHEILVPIQEKIKISRGKKLKVKEKIFPGYMLVRMLMSDESWTAVRNTAGITGFVGMGKAPTPIPENEVDTIQKFAARAAPKFKASFSVGEAVKVSEGPFTEFLGTVSAIDEEKGKVTVLVSIFGRETPVELDFLQVAKI